jgi:hypothetical protein
LQSTENHPVGLREEFDDHNNPDRCDRMDRPRRQERPRGKFRRALCDWTPFWEREFPVIVIERDGKTIVITGWRAWVVAAVAVVVTTAMLAALAFLVVGIAVSMIAFLLIVMPAVAFVVLMAWFFQPRRR